MRVLGEFISHLADEGGCVRTTRLDRPGSLDLSRVVLLSSPLADIGFRFSAMMLSHPNFNSPQYAGDERPAAQCLNQEVASWVLFSSIIELETV